MSCSKPRDPRRLLTMSKCSWPSQDLLIVDELGYVPLSKTGASHVRSVFPALRTGLRSLVTSNLPFNEWTEIFGSERLTGALLDRLTQHVHFLCDLHRRHRMIQSKKKRADSFALGVNNRSHGFRENSCPWACARPKGRAQNAVPVVSRNRYPVTNWATLAPAEVRRFLLSRGFTSSSIREIRIIREALVKRLAFRMNIAGERGPRLMQATPASYTSLPQRSMGHLRSRQQDRPGSVWHIKRLTGLAALPM